MRTKLRLETWALKLRISRRWIGVVIVGLGGYIVGHCVWLIFDFFMER